MKCYKNKQKKLKAKQTQGMHKINTKRRRRKERKKHLKNHKIQSVKYENSRSDFQQVVPKFSRAYLLNSIQYDYKPKRGLPFIFRDFSTLVMQYAN